ncbi:alcohol dehydrogenase [Endozoicomonas montiporae]|uniref:Alcohol dehydrogenase n=2 Tax=Endozoicomonas montiporae TaxID=1027273 RepID=A0A081N8D2_9GAMM|nr:iron-containing alcohol dehydrogenase [Endozoicomonas montiporae]AMO55404.1 alcohol dehydrogenase [Endozoicomonas montiporae CL-33]KEQ14705.1 alcohol dehydrogenase [Endozoicomonas montiporae]
MNNSYYEFFSPVKIIAGHKALEHMPFELSLLDLSTPMIITDKGVQGAGLVEHVVTASAESNITVSNVFDDVPQDSSEHCVRQAADTYRKQGCDSIIAIGGGSVIDTSKAVNILVSEGGDDLSQYAGAHALKRPLKPFFVIPTTSGTGSEATLVAVISDDNGIKRSYASGFLLPNAAILDPRMTLTLPAHITAMTAMDAMTHAIESYTCLAANPVSDAYAFAAIKKISGHLFNALKNPSDADSRLALAEGSTMAGIAFSNSMVGMVHSLGHALGGVCHLPHGLCMNLFLPYVLEYNREVNGDKIGELLLPLAGEDIYTSTPKEQRAERAIDYISTLRDTLYQDHKLPRTLKETGKVAEDQLERIATVAIDDGSIIFNPKEADYEDILGVLRRAWSG